MVVTVIATGIDSKAEEAASKQLPGRSQQIKAQPVKEKEEAPKAEEPKQPVDRPQTVQPAAEKQEPEQPKQTMVDPTSVWGLNDSEDNQIRNTQPTEPNKDYEGLILLVMKTRIVFLKLKLALRTIVMITVIFHFLNIVVKTSFGGSINGF